MATIIGDIRREMAATRFPTGVSATLEGIFRAQEESMRTIGALSLISLGLVFAILYSRYRSALLIAAALHAPAALVFRIPLRVEMSVSVMKPIMLATDSGCSAHHSASTDPISASGTLPMMMAAKRRS